MATSWPQMMTWLATMHACDSSCVNRNTELVCAADAENCDPNAEEEGEQQRQHEANLIREVLEKHKPHQEFVEAVHKIVPELEMLLMYDQESDVSGAVGAHHLLCACFTAFIE